MANRIQNMRRRSSRVRRSLKSRANGRPRLSVFRSGKNIYAQIIDDVNGNTIAAASSLDKSLRGKATGADQKAARAVGKLIAERGNKAGIDTVIFDRGGYIFHGRVKALADAAREGGLQF